MVLFWLFNGLMQTSQVGGFAKFAYETELFLDILWQIPKLPSIWHVALPLGPV